MTFRYFTLFLLSLYVLPAHAALNIEISGAGANQIPIVVVPFEGDQKIAQSIAEVVSADLQRSGLFRLVDAAGKTPHKLQDVEYAQWAGVDALTIGSVATLPNGRIEAKFRLLDVVKQAELMGQAVSARSDQTRMIAHRIADMIYEKLTGDAGVFSTRIAYVNRQGKSNRIVVADSDGFGEQTVLTNNEPVMSLAWSPDGTQLAYVTFEQGHAVVYTQSLITNKRVLLANFRGSNSAPAWAPDGNSLAIVLARDGSSQIHIVGADGKNLRRVTFTSGNTIDTEPNFSPDGQHLLFTSDRGGSAQIYRVPVAGGAVERMTFDGGNNFSPRYSPDGKSFAFTHRINGKFYIAIQDFQTKQMQLLTGGGWEKRPSFSPNGKLILFASEAQSRGILATVSSDGRVKQKMIPQAGDIREPTWGPFLK